MFKLWGWIKSKYLDWQVDKALDGGTGTATVVNPLGLSNVTTTPSVQQVQSDKEKKYTEALARIKKKLKTEAEKMGGVNKENLETILARYQGAGKDGEWTEDLTKPDLLDLSEEEKNVWKQWQYDIKVYKHKDIKSDADMVSMIDRRIQHYYTLQTKRQIRALNRELRKAERNGNTDKANELWSQINELSGSIQRKAD